MITKEELEKLIEEKATIYYRGRAYRLNNIDERYSDGWYRQLYEITENGLHHIYEGSDGYDEDEDTIFNFKDLYKTKEEAEWHLKYTVERTERLELPTWEDLFDENRICDCYNYEFVCRNHYDLLCLVYLGVDFTNEIIEIRNTSVNQVVFNEVLTKENYIKVCDLCVKLFKGEEV